MAFSTDSGVYPHGDNARQFAYMVEYCMKPIEANRAATLNAAEQLGDSADHGIISKGAYADVIAVEGDPLDNAKVLENVCFVMKNGQVYKNTWER